MVRLSLTVWSGQRGGARDAAGTRDGRGMGEGPGEGWESSGGTRDAHRPADQAVMNAHGWGAEQQWPYSPTHRAPYAPAKHSVS